MRLAKYTYRAIGEFHAFGNDINTKALQLISALAKQYGLLLHVHSDAKAVDNIFSTAPGAMVLCVHSGFDHPEAVGEMLAKHKKLRANLAPGSDHASKGKVTDDWRKVCEAYPVRFTVGTDTFARERWYYVKSHADYSRKWLSTLPRELAEQIAYRNVEKMRARVEEVGER